MVHRKVKITSQIGIHLRPAGMLCDQASNYKCKIFIHHGEKSVNAKSLLSVLSACIRCDDEIEIECDGEDEIIALQEMVDMIDRKINCL